MPTVVAEDEYHEPRIEWDGEVAECQKTEDDNRRVNDHYHGIYLGMCVSRNKPCHDIRTCTGAIAIEYHCHADTHHCSAIEAAEQNVVLHQRFAAAKIGKEVGKHGDEHESRYCLAARIKSEKLCGKHDERDVEQQRRGTDRQTVGKKVERALGDVMQYYGNTVNATGHDLVWCYEASVGASQDSTANNY